MHGELYDYTDNIFMKLAWLYVWISSIVTRKNTYLMGLLWKTVSIYIKDSCDIIYNGICNNEWLVFISEAFIAIFSKYLLSTYDVLGTMLGT